MMMTEIVKEYIHSGIIELYLLGCTNEEENRDLEMASAYFPEIKSAIAQSAKAFEAFGVYQSIKPPEPLKPFLLATIDFMERLEAGEVPSSPPPLTPLSSALDYKPWLSRPDMELPADAEDTFIKILGANEQLTTAIVWAKTVLPAETHSDELESFLVLEGSCEIAFNEEKQVLKPGDILTIPLHTSHIATITSDIPCKLIVQRAKVAA